MAYDNCLQYLEIVSEKIAVSRAYSYLRKYFQMPIAVKKEEI